MIFLEYPKCSTCRKAKAWLDAHQINYTDRHIVEDNPSAAELAAWHQMSGLPLKKFFNTSGILYKEMNLKDKLPNSKKPSGRLHCMCKEQNRSADIKNELAAKSRATGIKEQVLAEINKLAETYQIKKVVLFGSRARGDFRERSDIDLAVYGGDFTRFSLDVDEKTWTLLQYDFVDMNQSVQPELIAAIEKEGVILYEKV